MRVAAHIEWDTDGDKELFNSLPQNIAIPDGMDDEDEISEYITNKTGFCHCGFDIIEI